MILSIGSRGDLTLSAFERVAWQGEKVSLSPTLLKRVSEARASFLRFIANHPDVMIYGVTSGYGSNAKRRLSDSERNAFAQRSMAIGAVSFGEPLPHRIVRGILFARLANLIEGHGATSVRIVESVADMLNGKRPVPPVPRDGNGCAGEILALYHLFAPLSEAFEMEIKEKGPLGNGAPCAAALLADAALAARRRFRLAVEIFALSVEAMRAPLEAYDPVLGELWNDADAGAALKLLNELLAGAPGMRRSYQAPVSYRILPRVLGRAHRAVRQAEQDAALLLPAVTDNPIYLSPDAVHPDGRSFSTGGYHDSRAVPDMDALAANSADLCLIAERHATKLLDGSVSGLPHHLVVDPATVVGGAASFSYLPMVLVGFLEAARTAATTTLLPAAEGGGFGQDDVVSPVFPAWEKQEAAGLALERGLAVLAVVASQALWVTERPTTPALEERLARIRRQVAPVDEATPRPLGPDCASLAQSFHHEVYVELRRG